MARHAKKKQLPVRWIVTSIVSVAAVGLVIVGILLVNNGVLDALAGIFTASSSNGSSTPESSGVSSAPSAPDSSDPSSDSSSEPEPPPPLIEGSGNYARPEQMRGVWLAPGVDYLVSGKETAAQVRQQIDAAFASLKEWEFNTLLLPLLKDGKALYPSGVYESLPLKEENGEDFDPLAYILECARKEGVFIYGILDCHVGEENGWDPTLEADREKIKNAAAEAAARYAFDGYLIEDYGYAYQRTGSEEAHQQQAPELDFNQFMSNCIKEAVTAAIQAVRTVNRDYYVGLLSGAVWAHSSVDERGSGTRGFYEEFTDGHADTLNWLDDGLFDFVLVKDYGSTNLSTANFNTVLDWWNQVAKERQLPLYIAHASDRVGSSDTGWNGTDQLSRQYLSCQGASQWQGSAYTSLAALKKSTASTTLLLKAMRGEVNEEYIAKELTITTPNKQSFTTLESKVAFQGMANPYFPLTVNGKAVTLSEIGYFGLEFDLSIGKNTFTFEQNGKKLVFTVTYEIQVIKSVSPTANTAGDGGTVQILNCIAYKGSTVYAMVNGKKIPMTARPIQPDEESGEDLSDYENFAGEYTLPAGIIGKEQDLGAVTFYASCKGLSKSMTGGRLTVNALPEPDKPEEPDLPGVIGDLQTIAPSTGGGETLATGKVVVITADYAETFTGSTTDDYSRPTNAYLPKGTTDRYVNKVGSYYLLGSGRRVYVKDAAVYNTEDFAANTVNITDFQAYDSRTAMTVTPNWRIPYNVQLLPQKYYRDTLSGKPDYAVNRTGQTTEYVDLTFYYTTAVGAAPDVSGSPLFSKAEWIKEEDNSYILRLTLKKKGAFYGYSVVWDNDGSLRFSFKHAPDIAGNPADQPLKGLTIVLDPGHGGASSGTGTGHNDGLYEKTLTLTYGLLLRDKLEALGATVKMTRTTDMLPDNGTMQPRVDAARNNGTDLFMSIHMNGVSSPSASGATMHYFYEYSYQIAQAVYDRMRAVEKNYDGLGNRASPCWWSPFYVTRFTDCPSILIECGFMTNPLNLDLLVNPSYQDRLTQAIAEGVVDYFRALSTRSALPETQEAAPMALWYAADFRKEHAV